MSFFKNKHVITAMIVAPILAVLAYFAVDFLVKENPHVAIAGQSYPLVAKSNCRFTSGECDLQNASFRSKLKVASDKKYLTLTSSHPLQSATLGFVNKDGIETIPNPMLAVDESNTSWQLALPVNAARDTTARVALQANDAFYFAETTMEFIDYETVFEQDFRKDN